MLNYIETTLKASFGDRFDRLLLLHIYSNSMQFTMFCGSIGSCHANSSLVMVQVADEILKPALLTVALLSKF